MLTAKDGDLDEAEALDTGADDYLAKPFSFAVLVARLRALLRRAGGARPRPGRRRATCGSIPARRRCWSRRRRGRADRARVRRARSSWCVAPARWCRRREILDGVWGDDFDGDPNIVEVYIRRLRRKIDEPFGSRADRDGPRRRLPPRGG